MSISERLSTLFTRCGFDRIDLVLGLSFVLVLGPWVTEVTAQPSARYLLTAAIVEQHTVSLDDYEPALGVDRVEINGHVYSDKAPLQPLLGVPILAVAEALGVPEASTYKEAGSIADWVDGNVGAWTQTFTFSVLPGAALLLLMRRHARRYVDDRAATVCAVALAGSTMILLFSTYLYAHVFSTCLAFAAWHLVSSDRFSPDRRVGVAGVLAGAGVAAEYPVLGAVAVIALWVWHTHGFRRAVLFGLPTVVAGCTLLAWNQAVYGTFGTSYGHKSGSASSIGGPKLYNTFEIFLGRKGFVFTPIVLLAIAGLVIAVWQRRPHVLVPAGVFAFAYLLQASWGNPWGGEPANPRYMLLALPFLVVPLAHARTWVSPLFFRALIAIGVISMGLPVVTSELVPDGGALISTHIRYLVDGEMSTTIFNVAVGEIGWVLYAVAAVVGAVVALNACRSRVEDSIPDGCDPSASVTAITVPRP